MKIIGLIFGVVILELALAQPAGAQFLGGKSPEATYLVYSNNSGFTPETDIRILMEAAFVHASQREIAESKNSRRKRTIMVYFPTRSTDVIFNGTGEDLRERGQNALAAIQAFEDNCNDLVLTYDHIKKDVEEKQYRRIRIVHIGKFVHSKAGCDGDTVINTPQSLPQELVLGPLLADMAYAEFTALAIHPDQYSPLYDHLNAHGVIGKSQYEIDIRRINETYTYVESFDQTTDGVQ